MPRNWTLADYQRGYKVLPNWTVLPTEPRQLAKEHIEIVNGEIRKTIKRRSVKGTMGENEWEKPHAVEFEDEAEPRVVSGYDYIRALFDKYRFPRIPNKLVAPFLVTAFLTGGRENEVLRLKRNNFDLNARNRIEITGMRVFKKYKRHKIPTGNGGFRYEREYIEAERAPFEISMEEPLADLLWAHVEQFNPEDWLFPSPEIKGQHISDVALYCYMREDIFPHALCCLRASCLANQYHYSVPQLTKFFSKADGISGILWAQRYVKQNHHEQGDLVEFELRRRKMLKEMEAKQRAENPSATVSTSQIDFSWIPSTPKTI